MLFSLFFLAPLVSCALLSHRHDSHDHLVEKRLPGTWYHEQDHPVGPLFKRGDDAEFAPVGSPAWMAGFPSPTASPDTNTLPSAWVDALNAAVAAGVIPNIPQSTGTPTTNPVYPAGTDPMSPEVCSATYKCRNAEDFWDVPDGHFGTGFDDGPTPSTPKLLQFLVANNEKATHFMIGANVIWYPQQFLQTFNSGDDIAVHTWSHPHMTTLSNLQILAELGWSMQIIYNSTGGRIPKYWRPPYGDSDNRVRAIAKEVFGLSTIIWNHDTLDWSMASGGTNMSVINASMTGWITGPKSPGLVVLEHELTDDTVGAFMSAYPLLKQYGWQTAPITQLVGGKSAYWNAGSTGPVSTASILAFAANTVTPTSTMMMSTSAQDIGTPSTSSTPTDSGSNNAVTQQPSSGVSDITPRTLLLTILLGLSFLVL